MTGAERLALAIHRRLSQRSDPVDFGVATVASGSGMAMVTGLAVDALPVPRAQWHADFVDEVAAAGDRLTGRRVIVLFKNGRPTILGTMGA